MSLSKVPSIAEFLEMTNVEINKLLVNNCQPSDLYKGISQQVEHPVIKQILALKYFLHKSQCSDERAKLFDCVIPKLTESLTELFRSTQLDVINSLLPSFSLTLCETVDSTRDDTSLTLRSLALGILNLLLEIFKLICDRSNLQCDDATQLENLLQSVHDVGLKILNFLVKNEPKYFSEEHNHIGAITFVNKLIFVLCELAEFASKTFQPKLLAAVWRCILVFCTGSITDSHFESVAGSTMKSMKFLSCAVNKCCFCIKSGLQDICESADESTSKFHNKTIDFITSILQRLALTYPHNKFEGHDDVLTTLLISIRKIRTQLQPNELLSHSLAISLQNVLMSICKSQQFIESFCSASCDEFSFELLHIGVTISKKLINEGDSEFLHFFMKYDDKNMACKLLQCLLVDTLAFTRTQVYMETVEVLSILLIRASEAVNPNIILNMLANSLLQYDSILGYILIDLWSEWARCLSQAQRLSLILFWADIVENIDQPIHLHMKIPIQNLYEGLTDEQKQRFRFSKPINANFKLWTTIGLHRLAETDTSAEIMELHSKIGVLFREFSTYRKQCTLSKLIEHLHLMGTMSPTNNSVPGYLMDLWNLNFNHQLLKFSSLITSLIKISIVHKEQLENNEHRFILQKINSIAGTSNITTVLKIEIITYLSHIAMKYFAVECLQDIEMLIRQLFSKLCVDSDAVVKRIAFTAYAKVVNEAKHDGIGLDHITDDVSLKTELFDFVRRNKTATKSRREQTQFAEKLRQFSIRNTVLQLSSTEADDSFMHGNDENEIRIKEIIERMHRDTKELVELNRKHKLKVEFCENIAIITEQLMPLKYRRI